MTTKKPKFALTHARHDPWHCLTPGLFRSLKKGDRKRLKLHAIYEHRNVRIEFKGPEPLGADDLKVLHGLVAMAGPCKGRLSPQPQTEGGKQLRLALEPKWDAIHENAIVVKGSYKTLAKEIGYANSRNTKKIRECIERLWSVSIIAQIGSKRMGFRLLSAYAGDQKNGRLYVALNPLIAYAVWGKRYIRIEMNEVRSLKSDAAIIIHPKLCAYINPGQSKRVRLDTLCKHVWPETTNGSTLRMRQIRMRRALKELKQLGWTVREYTPGKFEITRPSKLYTLHNKANELSQ